MRDDWEIKKLNQTCKFIMGQAPNSKTYNNDGIGDVFYRVGDFGEKYPSSNTYTTNPLVFGKEGDVFLCIVGATCGKVNLGKNGAITRSIAALRPDKNIIQLYLYYFLLKMYFDLNNISTGSAQPILNKTTLSSIDIPVPSIQEQKKIVEILGQAFESIEKAKANIEKNIENAKELFKSMLNQIFFQAGEGWEQDIMVNLCDVLTCGVASTPKYVDESVGVPFLSAQNVKNGKVVLHKYRYISKEFHEHLTKKNKPTKGDILYTRVGAKFGEAAVVEHSFDFSVYVSLTLIRPNSEKLNNYYFKYYLNSPSIKSLAKSSITSSGVPNLNVKTVRDFPVFYPDLNKQKEIVETLDTIDNHIQSVLLAYNEELKNLEELKKSILQKAFNGELTNKNKAA